MPGPLEPMGCVLHKETLPYVNLIVLFDFTLKREPYTEVPSLTVDVFLHLAASPSA